MVGIDVDHVGVEMDMLSLLRGSVEIQWDGIS